MTTDDGFRATHLDVRSGHVNPVHLTADGIGYTRDEWDVVDAADLECVDGEWRLLGQPYYQGVVFRLGEPLPSWAGTVADWGTWYPVLDIETRALVGAACAEGGGITAKGEFKHDWPSNWHHDAHGTPDVVFASEHFDEMEQDDDA